MSYQKFKILSYVMPNEDVINYHYVSVVLISTVITFKLSFINIKIYNEIIRLLSHIWIFVVNIYSTEKHSEFSRDSQVYGSPTITKK